jgi:hypothetical protein
MDNTELCDPDPRDSSNVAEESLDPVFDES